MKNILLIVGLLISSAAMSMNEPVELFRYNSARTESAAAELSDQVKDAVILNLDREIFDRIVAEKSNTISLLIPISETQKVPILLERFEILAADARTVVRSMNGETPVNLRDLVLSYKGSIVGAGNSLVSLSFYNGKVIGLMKSRNDTYVLGSLYDKNNKETNDYVLYQDSKLMERRDFKCGSDQFTVPDEIIRKMQELDHLNTDLSDDLRVAKVAIDVDYYTYGVYGNSVPNASAYALALMSAASAVYVKDMNVRLVVSYLRVWTTQDPYTSTDGPTLLNQFRNEWITNQGSVDRAIAHLVSRRNDLNVAGIAYLNVLCNPSYGYGLSATLNGTINQLPAYSYDVVVIAHEIGHNFGSPHTHNCSWAGGPIDTCVEVEGGCYSGPTHPTAGTIMSYCDIVPGGSVIMDFGDQPGALIRNYAEAAFCLNNSDRPIFTAYPNGGETFRTLTQTRIYWGTSLSGNVNLEYTSDNGASWNVIQNNVPAQQREFAWTVPYIGYTNQAKVRVLNSSNASEGDTSDAAFKIILTYVPFNVLSPPTLSTIQTASNNSNPERFTWNRAGTHPSLRYKFKIRKIGTIFDYVYTSDNNGADTAISLRNSFLDSLARTLGTTGDSVRCSWRAWAYNGYDSTQSSNANIVTLKRTNVGISQISSVIPERFDLGYNYPNPFNPATIIKFDVAKTQRVRLLIYDMLGREIEVLADNVLQPGKYQATFSGAEHTSGVYYYRLETEGFTETRKMVLVK
jgi:hypothetical protein